MTKKILIIHTGGTISMEADEATNEVTQRSETHPLANINNSYFKDALITETYLFNIPSPYMTTHRMLELGNYIKSETSEYDGVVITHGTDTLEETAYFLQLYLDVKIPVILTGAMRSSNELGSDGVFNLITAVRVLQESMSDQGVLVVMNGEIHLAKEVYKSSSIQLDSFKSPYGPIGIVTPTEVQWFRRSSGKTKKSQSLSKLSKSVSLLKLSTSTDETFLKHFFNIPMDGIVIEAYGQGNVPEFLVEYIDQKIKTGVPIVITSRTIDGFVKPTYSYSGGGADLVKWGIIPASHLTSQKACIQLILGLENNFELLSYFK